MSIKPIDFQVMYPKSAEVSKIIKDETSKNQIVNQQQTALTQQTAEQKLKQVIGRENVQNGRIREKQEKENPKQKDKKNKQQKKDPNVPSIDIKI